MDDARLCLCNSVAQENDRWLIPPVDRTQIISHLFVFRFVHEWNLLSLESIASPSLFLFNIKTKNLA